MHDGTLTRNQVASEVCGLIAETLDRSPSDVVTHSKFATDLEIDSMGMIETQVKIEERFDIALPDFDELAGRRLEVVDDLVDLVVAELEKVSR